MSLSSFFVNGPPSLLTSSMTPIGSWQKSAWKSGTKTATLHSNLHSVNENCMNSTISFRRRIRFFPISSRANVRASERTNERSGAHEPSEQCGAMELLNSAIERASGRTNGPVLAASISYSFYPLCAAENEKSRLCLLGLGWIRLSSCCPLLSQRQRNSASVEFSSLRLPSWKLSFDLRKKVAGQSWQKR